MIEEITEIDIDQIAEIEEFMHVCFSFCLITLYLTLTSNFPSNRINFIHRHKLLPCLQKRPLQVYGTIFIYTTDGIVVENFILYNIMCVILFCFSLFILVMLLYS